MPEGRKKKGNVGSEQRRDLFKAFFFSFIGIRYDNRQTEGRFPSPVSIRQD